MSCEVTGAVLLVRWAPYVMRFRGTQAVFEAGSIFFLARPHEALLVRMKGDDKKNEISYLAALGSVQL